MVSQLYKTTKEVCSYLGISQTTLKKLRKSDFPFTRIGSSLRYDLQAVDAWVKQNSNSTLLTTGITS